MIICNGCSKSGTHFLTSLMLSMGKEQFGGTLIKRPSRAMYSTSKRPLSQLFTTDNTQFVHSHLIFRETLSKKLADHLHLFIRRHPRNIAISWMRHRLKQDTSLQASETFLLEIITGGMFGHSVADFVLLHAPWIQQDSVCTVRFEDLVARDMHALKKISDYVGAESEKQHYENAFGHGSTYMGSFSDWSNSPYWTDTVEKAWQDHNGLQAEHALGYGQA